VTAAAVMHALPIFVCVYIRSGKKKRKKEDREVCVFFLVCVSYLRLLLIQHALFFAVMAKGVN
jgi:hypothetical protein